MFWRSWIKTETFKHLSAELGGVLELVGYFHAYYPGLTVGHREADFPTIVQRTARLIWSRNHFRRDDDYL
jgi:hypothetical protein